MPKATAGQIVEVPLVIGGQFTAGDPSTQPESTVRLLRNYLFRPNRVDARPPFVADSSGVTGTPSEVTRYLQYENLSGFTTDTLMIESSAGNLHKRGADGESWTFISAITPLANSTYFLSDYANLKGAVVAMFADQANGGIPAARMKWDGTTAKFDATQNDVMDAALYSRTLTSFIDRYFLGYVRATVTPKTRVSFGASVYDFTNSLWNKNNVTATNLTANGVTKCVLYPTNATFGQSYLYPYTGSGPTLGLASFAATDTVRTATLRWDLQNQHESYDMPIQIRILLITDWQANHAYAKGDLISDGAYRQRCTTAGTSGAGAPAWNTTRNGTTSDNTVTWTNEGTRDLAVLNDTIPNASSDLGKDATTFFVSAPIPSATNTLTVSPLLVFGNSTNATITLAPIVASVKDGLADGAAGKANRGCQMTLSEFKYPFVNTETATSAAIDIDDVMWSEINQPNRIIASSTFSLNEIAGHVTAAAVAGGRLFFFKRRGMWQFARTSDVNVPILPERSASVDYGCIGPQCIDVFQDELFWIDDHEIYRMRVGEEPKPICGPGMREEILAHGTNWIENTAPDDVPWLKVDKANRDVWVFTQVGLVYVYHLDSDTWGYIDKRFGGTGGHPIFAMHAFFDVVGQRMIASTNWGVGNAHGLVRMDENYTSADDSGAITKDIIFRPLETFSPDRFELSVQGVNLFHNATAWPAGATLTLQYSLNRGTTWTTPSGYPITTVDVTDPLIPLGIVQGGHSIMLRVLVAGDGGAANWSISKASAKIRVESGEFYYTTAT